MGSRAGTNRACDEPNRTELEDANDDQSRERRRLFYDDSISVVLSKPIEDLNDRRWVHR